MAPAAALPAGVARAGKALPPDLALAATTMGLISTNVCAVMQSTTEGPYYNDPRLVRSDITEQAPRRSGPSEQGSDQTTVRMFPGV